MKTYDINKFWFKTNYNWGGRFGKDGDMYCRLEWCIRPTFPFIKKEVICYTLKNNRWVQEK
jgi:hypothetical protein